MDKPVPVHTVERKSMRAAYSAEASPSGVSPATANVEPADVVPGNVRVTWMVLRMTFSVVPVVAGLDKFTNLLTHWENYLSPSIANLLPFSPSVFMGIVGIIEVAAGLIVYNRPRIGALIVAAWLVLIALSLIAGGQYLDVAVRDLVMGVAAFALAKLSSPGGR
jgi:hypothetical protein